MTHGLGRGANPPAFGTYEAESDLMADSERNLMEEVGYLSGCVFAHDIISLHLSKILIDAGVIESFGLETILSAAETADRSLPQELQEGYRATLQKLRENIRV